eukprot:71514_1
MSGTKRHPIEIEGSSGEVHEKNEYCSARSNKKEAMAKQCASDFMLAKATQESIQDEEGLNLVVDLDDHDENIVNHKKRCIKKTERLLNSKQDQCLPPPPLWCLSHVTGIGHSYNSGCPTFADLLVYGLHFKCWNKLCVLFINYETYLFISLR